LQTLIDVATKVFLSKLLEYLSFVFDVLDMFAPMYILLGQTFQSEELPCLLVLHKLNLPERALS
jgi:hypothetical protein